MNAVADRSRLSRLCGSIGVGCQWLKNPAFDRLPAVVVNNCIAQDTVEPGRGGVIGTKRGVLIKCSGICSLKDVFGDSAVPHPLHNELQKPPPFIDQPGDRFGCHLFDSMREDRKGIGVATRLEVMKKVGECWQFQQMLAGRGRAYVFMFKHPGVVMRDKDGMEPCTESWIDI
jgi:hypothetical protein